MNITLADLRTANLARQHEWCPDQKPDLSFRGNELSGEIGETLEAAVQLLILGSLAGRASNLVKKLERKRHGWVGSRATITDLAEELGDIVICCDLVAVKAGIDLQHAVINKFNSTSEKNGLRSRLTSGCADIQAQTLDASTIRIQRTGNSFPIFRVTSANTLTVRAGTVIEIDGRSYDFEAETPVFAGAMIAGTDYGIALDEAGAPFVTALSANPLSGSLIGGFHFAPGGNAADRNGGDAVPAINACSLWDRDFRPNCPDPRGMTLVETRSGRIWVDIYLLGINHEETGTSRQGVEIADGRSLSCLDYQTAVDIYASHGKRLLTCDEFTDAAFGVTERSSADHDPKATGLDACRTSKFGLMQATGNLWIWGTDGDAIDPRPSLFGGSWLSGSFAGSRCAYLDYWPGYSYVSISARGGSDHLSPV